MVRVVRGLVVIGILVSLGTEARAEGPAAVERFSFLDAPPPAPPPMPPAPEREGAERARKTWEVVPRVGWSAPSCRAADAGGSACDGIRAGTSFGAGALFRITPYVAFGVDLDAIDFAYDPSANVAGASAGKSRALFVGPLFRGYFTERGSVDPWVSVGFGGGTLTTSYELGGATYGMTESGAATSIGAGVDFWLSPWLKLGPTFEERVVFPTEIETCRDAACRSRTISEAGGVTRTTRIALNVTLAFGREM